MRQLILLLTTCAMTTPVFADTTCSAPAPQQKVQLVELYTSEGCSSCPPADRWLSALEADDTLIPLAFHVDYWNYLGWRDRFSDSRYTQRQRQIGAYNRQATIYTPEVVVNGAEHRRWHTDLPRAAATAATLNFDVTAEFNGNRIAAELNSQESWPTNARAFIAVTESQLTTEVARGENRGRTLTHDHVVRAYAGPFRPDQALDTQVPDDLKPDHAALVVWLEDKQTGQTLQAMRMPLQNCAAQRS